MVGNRPGIKCDRCGIVRLCQDQSIEDLRGQLVTVGWMCRTTPDGVEMDVCPTCRAKK